MRLLDFHAVNLEQKRNIRQSPSRVKAIQSRKIQQVVKHAYETVPYYRDMFQRNNIKPQDIRHSADLQRIPVSTKQDIIDAGDTIISSAYRKADLTMRKTGGSTGNTLAFYQSYRDGLYASVSYDRARIQNGFSPLLNKIVLIGAFRAESRHKVRWRDRIDLALKLRRRPVFLDMADDQQKLERILGRTSYDSIKGYPSLLYILARRVQDGALTMSVMKHVFTAAEMLDDRTRAVINSTFNVDVKDIYGCWEGGCIGWECEKHEGYHANIDLVALQISDENGVSSEYGKGNLVLTNLTSHAVPFIRYQTNDIVELTPDYCSCGRPLPLITSLLGRRDDFVVLPNGRRISPSGLIVVVQDCSRNVLEFQIMQEKVNELHVRIVLVGGADKQKAENDIRTRLENHLNSKDVKITVTTVEAIDRTLSGKHRSIVSRVTGDVKSQLNRNP